jgi:hypothetical protein
LLLAKYFQLSAILLSGKKSRLRGAASIWAKGDRAVEFRENLKAKIYVYGLEIYVNH